MSIQKTIHSGRSPNIWYNISINTNIVPTTGDLAFTLLKHGFGISCNIRLDTTLSEYTTAILAVVGNQVRSKSLRSPYQLTIKPKAPVLYRDNLLLDIPSYLSTLPPTMAIHTEMKGLLLNDLTLDTHAGDAEIKPFFRFERSDKTHDFYLSPGCSYKNLIEIIGMNLFSINISIDELLDEIISDIAGYFITDIVSYLHISGTFQLEQDIIRYLQMAIYGI